jgi:hypothetical protein
MKKKVKNTTGNNANTVLPPVKTLASFIKLCDRISNMNRDEMKGIKNANQYMLVGIIRASVQNELKELKELLP